MTPIENRNRQDINKNLLSEHKKQEKGKWYNQEILSAAQNLIAKIKNPLDKISTQIQSFANPTEKSLYISKWTELNKRIQETTKGLNTWSFMTKHKDIIRDLAHKIDNTENDVITIIQNVQQIKEVAEEETVVDNTLKNIEKQKNKNYFMKTDNGVIKLTKDVNEPRIDEVLSGLIVDGKTWKIDYSACSNTSIKSKMEAAIGSDTCYITKGLDKDGTETFVLLDYQGNKLEQRALIWEGVTITSDATIKKTAVQELRKTNKQIVAELTDQQKTELIQDIPTGLKQSLSNIGAGEFIVKSESILDALLLDAKNHGWELQVKPVSKIWVGKAIMELHLINGYSEKNIPIFTKENSGSLYNILNDNESDLMRYLTVRVQQKRQGLSHLTKKSNILANNPEGTPISQDQQQNTLYGLTLTDQLIASIIQRKGNTWLSGDKDLRLIKNYIQDAIYSIENGNPTKQDLDKIQKELAKHFAIWMGVFDNSLLTNIIQGLNKEDVVKAIRSLGEKTTIFANTHTTFLREEIDDDLKISNIEYNTYLTNIASQFGFDIDGNNAEIPPAIRKNIDGLYAVVQKPGSGNTDVLLYMQQLYILPTSISIKDKNIDDICKKIYETVSHRSTMLTTLKTPSSEDIKQGLHKERLLLEQQDNKSETDIARIQTLLYIQEDPSIINALLQQQVDATKDVLKYGGMDDVLRGVITPWLAKKGGGVLGKNADIYNDSVGVGGWLDRSDENATQAAGWTKVMIEEVAIALVAIGAGIVTGGAATAWIYGARIAAASGRVLQIGSKAKTLRLLFNLSKAKKLHSIGKLQRLKDLKRVESLTTWGRAKNLLNPSIHGMVGSLLSGTTYAGMSTTLRGQWDAMTPEKFGAELLQGAAMIGVLKVAGQLFPGKNVGSFLKRVLTEETVINTADRGKMTYLGEGPYGPSDFTQNMLLGFLFEGVFHYGGPALKIIKDRIKLEGVEKVVSQELMIPQNKAALSKVIDQVETGVLVQNPRDILISRQLEDVPDIDARIAFIESQLNGSTIDEAIAIVNKYENSAATPRVKKLLEVEYNNYKKRVDEYNNIENRNGKPIDNGVNSKGKTNKPEPTKNSIDESSVRVVDDATKNTTESARMNNMSTEEVKDILQNIPNDIAAAMSRMELLGVWLGKNIAGPGLQLASDIRKRIKSVELKFPDIKLSQYYKELREQAIQALEKISDQARLNIIKQMEKVSNLGKVKFMDKLIDKIHLYGEAELVALYKMIGGKSDPWDRVIDGNSFKESIVSDIKDLYKKMKKDLDVKIKKESEIFREYPIESVNTFDDLYRQLDEVGTIYSKSSEKIYTAKELKTLIDKVRSGEVNIGYITRELGLRTKVESLLSLNTKFDINRCSPKAKQFVEQFGEPKNTIDLGNGSVLHVTDILQQQGGYKFIVGYALHNGKLEPRLFYRSGSEGARRSCPGQRQDGRYSKAEFLENSSYETTTKLDTRMGSQFDGFSSKPINEDLIEFSERFGFNFLEDQMKQSIKVEKNYSVNLIVLLTYTGEKMQQML